MLLLTKVVLCILIGFLSSVLLGSLLVPYLRRKKINQTLSIYLEERHHKKAATPTMGGLIFIFSSLLSFFIFYLLGKVEITYNVLIILFTFLGYGIIGFIDDYLIIRRKNNAGLSEGQKWIGQIVIAMVFFYLFMLADNEPLLWIHSIHLKWNIGWFYGLFILFVLLASSNAVNLTDGLDGLAGGLATIALFTFGILTLATGWLEGYTEIAYFLFLLVGSLLGFLLFNVNPAKIFMGDTGSLALGAVLGAVAILTRHELLLIVIGIVFVLETVSCILQRYYYKLTKKRLFPMAPIHHSFEKLGFEERDIVKLFWMIGLIGGMFGMIYGVWL